MKKQKVENNIKIVIAIAVMLVIVCQAIAAYVVENMQYAKNTGGAFGIGGDGTVGFIVVSLIVIAIILRFLFSKKEMIDKKTGIALSFILAGGLSNLIERIIRGFVVDYIDISNFLKFPVFNLADMLIVVGWIVLVVCIIFYWNKEIK